jgi:hypothetical protein
MCSIGEFQRKLQRTQLCRNVCGYWQIHQSRKRFCMERNRLHLWYSKVLQRFWRRPNKTSFDIFNLKYNIDKKYYDCRCPIYKVCREFINRSHWYGFRQNINIECGQRRQNQFAEVLRIWRNPKKTSLITKVDGHLNELKKYPNT